MKGFIVVDRLNDSHFLDIDKEFARHINEQAKESGLLSEDYHDYHTVDPNIVMQQFSPLIMSQWFMIDQSRNPCSSITCENGFLFVFKHFEDFLIIAMNGDGTESEDFLTRKCLVFIRLVGFVHGPVVNEIGRPKFVGRPERWKYLRNIMATWVYLANNEQSFLVEAVERLHVNQMVNEQCIEFLQSAVTRLQETGEKNSQHALILVNSKLLALYSNRNAQELQAADSLCILLLVRSLFPTHERLEDLFAQTYHRAGTDDTRCPASVKVPGTSPSRDRYESAAEGFTTGDETENEELDQYFSAVDSPMEIKVAADSRSFLNGIAETEDLDNSPSQYPEVSERFFTPAVSPRADSSSSKKEDSSADSDPNITRPRSHTAGEIHENVMVKGQAQKEEPVARGRSRSFSEQVKGLGQQDTHSCSDQNSSESQLPTADRGPVDDDDDGAAADVDYIKQTVFLNTAVCRYSPYQIHCKRLSSGIVLVVLTEMSKVSQSTRLVQLLQYLKDLISGHRDSVNRNQGHIIYDVINSQLSKMLVALRKAKGHVEKLCQDIRKKWESEDLKGRMLTYLEQRESIDVSPVLERALKSLHGTLMQLFLYLYLSPRQTTPAMTDAMATTCQDFTQNLGDFRDYLMVKAQRNITMTTYIDDFPGLVHFIYINRRTNQVIAPALNITHKEESSTHDATQLLKDKIWAMTEWMHEKLHEGYTSVTARDGDYYFSYFLWFENCAGEPEVVQRPYKADSTAPPPGVLTGNFYKYLTRKCFPNMVPNSVHCNELMMMHIGLVHPQYIANQCRELAAVLWETSGDVFTSINLL